MQKRTFKILPCFLSVPGRSQVNLIPILHAYPGHRGEANSSNTGKLHLTHIVSDLERGSCLDEDPSPCLWAKIQALVSTMTSEEDSCGHDCVCSHSRKSDPEVPPHYHALGVLGNVSK